MNLLHRPQHILYVDDGRDPVYLHGVGVQEGKGPEFDWG